MPRGLGQRVLDQRLREQQAATIGHRTAGPGQDLDAGRRRVGKANLGQQPQRGAVDLDHVLVAQRAVPARHHPGRHRAQVIRQGPGTQGTPRITSGPPGLGLTLVTQDIAPVPEGTRLFGPAGTPARLGQPPAHLGGPGILGRPKRRMTTILKKNRFLTNGKIFGSGDRPARSDPLANAGQRHAFLRYADSFFRLGRDAGLWNARSAERESGTRTLVWRKHHHPRDVAEERPATGRIRQFPGKGAIREVPAGSSDLRRGNDAEHTRGPAPMRR